MHRLPTGPLKAERLEDRLTPAVTIQFDYSRDVSGFFQDAGRKQVLEQVAAEIAPHLTTSLPAILNAGANGFSTRFFDPATGDKVTLPGVNIPADTIVVYVGGRDLAATEAAVGGSGAYVSQGAPDFLNAIRHRNPAGVSIWGGSIGFDLGQDWYTGADIAKLGSGQTDLATVVAHELGHVLGLGTATQFSDLVAANGTFTGAQAISVYGGAVPVSPDGAHFAQADTLAGEEISLRPYLVHGKRYGLSRLEYAALADIGWQVVPPVPVPPHTAAQVAAPSPTPTPTQVAPPALAATEAPTLPTFNVGATRGSVAISGGNGTVQLYNFSGGSAKAVGDVLTPFPGFTGTVRAATADVSGDGVPDLIAVTGPGGGSRIRVIDGKLGTDIASTFTAFESTFTGGLYVASADIDGDGKADVIVSPDVGGGGRVMAFNLAHGVVTMADFYGIDDPDFRGGARVAAADVNGDGKADIVVGAGEGGGPRVAIFDGANLRHKLVNDFFAFNGADVGGLRNGVFVTAGDLNGDGKAELAFGGGPGGAPRVLVFDGALTLSSPAAAAANPVANYYAFAGTDRSGVRVAIKDAGGDGKFELIAATGDGVPQVKLFDRATELGTHEPFGFAVLADGVYVG